MIRINTAPLGMQNLLSGNRKLYVTMECLEFGNNGNDKLIKYNSEDLIFPIDPPFVMANEDGSKVVYSDKTVNVDVSNGHYQYIDVTLKDECNNVILKQNTVDFGNSISFSVNVGTVKNMITSLVLIINEGIGNFSLFDENNRKINLNEYNMDDNDYLDNGKLMLGGLVVDCKLNLKNTGRKLKRIYIEYASR